MYVCMLWFPFVCFHFVLSASEYVSLGVFGPRSLYASEFVSCGDLGVRRPRSMSAPEYVGLEYASEVVGLEMYRLRRSLASEFVGPGVCAPRSLSASEASGYVSLGVCQPRSMSASGFVGAGGRRPRFLAATFSDRKWE